METVLHIIDAAVQHPLEFGRPIGFYVLVGIFAPLDGQHTHRQTCRTQERNCTGRSLLPRFVRVIRNHDFFCVARHQTGLGRRKRRPKRGDGIRKTRLVHRNHIHISFTEDQAARSGIFCEIEGKQHVPLAENRRFRRIKVLGLIIPERAAAKCDDVSAQVNNGKHHPAVKAVYCVAGSAFKGNVC